MHKLVLLRHGESDWNRENRFTGWTDVDLSQKGIEEARAAGRLLKSGGYAFDLAFTSVLKRAVRTLWLALDELDRMWLPEVKDWRLNERHYGALQGLSKPEMAARFGEQQVLIWRRSYDTPPPALAPEDPRSEAHDPRYAGIIVPRTECLKDTVARVVPYWETAIAPQVRAGKRKARGARCAARFRARDLKRQPRAGRARGGGPAPARRGDAGRGATPRARAHARRAPGRHRAHARRPLRRRRARRPAGGALRR